MGWQGEVDGECGHCFDRFLYLLLSFFFFLFEENGMRRDCLHLSIYISFNEYPRCNPRQWTQMYYMLYAQVVI